MSNSRSNKRTLCYIPDYVPGRSQFPTIRRSGLTVAAAEMIERARANNSSTPQASSSHFEAECGSNQRHSLKRKRASLDNPPWHTLDNRPRLAKPRPRTEKSPAQPHPRSLAPASPPDVSAVVPISFIPANDEDEGELRVVTEEDHDGLMKENVSLRENLEKIVDEYYLEKSKVETERNHKAGVSLWRGEREIKAAKKGRDQSEKRSNLELDLHATTLLAKNELDRLKEDYKLRLKDAIRNMGYRTAHAEIFLSQYLDMIN